MKDITFLIKIESLNLKLNLKILKFEKEIN